MKIPAMLSIRGSQKYGNQPPEIIELMTEGTLEYRNEGWEIVYQETELTGMAGVTTMFRVEQDKIILERTGSLNSTMIFQEGKSHESLYKLDFGALMLSVCARRITANISKTGGTVDLTYSIQIENNEAGEIDYHLDIQTKS